MFYIWKTLKYDDLKENSWHSTGRTEFTFPHTLGGIFFGISLILFYSTIKQTARSELQKWRKALALLILGILLIFGIFAHIFVIEEVVLWIRPWINKYYDNELMISINVYNNYRPFVEKLHGFIVIFTGWVTAHVLAARAYILVGRKRGLGIFFVFVLYTMFLVQLMLFCMGYRYRSAFPAHPIINLVIQVSVTLAVIYHAYKNGSEHQKGGFDIFEDVLIDSGALLTIGLILQMIFPFTGVGFEPMNFALPHLQNITACTVFTRLINREDVGGALRLPTEDIFTQPVSQPTSPA